ncbi:unnamed protein product [Durusdinium trenchii]|uniref:Uncharacterized protein n=1 Tax=Durusdinium trenchii TaxID=1381693 RepID=A0ABP0M3U9_9DINO
MVAASVMATLWVRMRRCSEFQADCCLAIASCPPLALMMQKSVYLCEDHQDPKLHTSYILCESASSFEYFSGCCVTGSLIATLALVQAGCYPSCCLFSTAALSMATVWMLRHAEKVFRGQGIARFHFELSPLHILLINWAIVISASIDFWARLHAVRRGIEQSRQNAERSATFLSMLDSGPGSTTLRPPRASPMNAARGREPNVEHMRGASLELAQWNEPLKTPKARRRLSVCALRHGQRADDPEAFDEWGCSEDAERFPHDPPLTPNGFQQAELAAKELLKEGLAFDVVITSPYLRCIQTALVVCETFKSDLLLDYALSEVYGAPVFEHPPKQERPWESLMSCLQASDASAFGGLDLSRIKAARLMGQRPQWPETMPKARMRYAKRFLDYLRRARHTNRSCLLVSHGHMVQVCASLFPANQHRQISKVDYCGAVAATWNRQASRGSDDVSTRRHRAGRSATVDLADLARNDETGGRLQQNTKLKYWKVWMRGLYSTAVRGHEGAAPSKVLQELHDLEHSEPTDVDRLLGLRPPELSEFEDSNAAASSFARTSESNLSFSTNTKTASSMANFRNPARNAGAPPSFALDHHQSRASDDDTKPAPDTKQQRGAVGALAGMASSPLAQRRAASSLSFMLDPPKPLAASLAERRRSRKELKIDEGSDFEERASKIRGHKGLQGIAFVACSAPHATLTKCISGAAPSIHLNSKDFHSDSVLHGLSIVSIHRKRIRKALVPSSAEDWLWL